MLFLGFDVATKSMGVSLIEYNATWETDIINIINKSSVDCDTYDVLDYITYFIQVLDKIDARLNKVYNPIFLDVVDLIPKKKVKGTSPMLISQRLAGYLCGISGFIQQHHSNSKLTVLLEYQMGPNDKSRGIGSQVLYHFSNPNNNYNNVFNLPKKKMPNNIVVKIVGASLKNKVNYDKEKPHSFFVGKYAKMYTANKKHSIHNFLYWLNLCGFNNLIKPFKKKNYDDIADAVNMTIAWIIKNEYRDTKNIITTK